MKRWTTALSTANELSLVAIEEASRRGVRSADLEHLLLALTVSDQPAGALLRRHGATLEAVRDAVDEHHAEHLAAVGITDASFPRERLREDAVEHTDLTERVRTVFHHASAKDRPGDAAAVLSQLLAEPSGTVRDILSRVPVDADAVAQELTGLPRQRSGRAVTVRPGVLAAEREQFVPAEPSTVWALVSAADRLPEWEPSVVSLQPAAAEAAEAAGPPAGPPGEATAVWSGTPRPRRRRDGRPVPPRPGWERVLIERVEHHQDERVLWRFSHPDAPRAAQRTLEITLRPSPGGTTVQLGTQWTRPQRRTLPGLRLIARPLTRFAAWLHLHQVGAGISRALRR